MQKDDNEIYSIMQKNQEKGFRMITEKYGTPVYWHIRRLLVSHADAQDVLQDTLIKVFRSFKSLKDPKALKAWIYRIATNEAIRMTQKNKVPKELLDRIDDTGTDITAEPYIDLSDVESVKLQKAILSLPPKQQAVFNMRYYDEMDYIQIAEAAECSASTAKVNYHLAKEKIIKYMNTNEI